MPRREVKSATRSRELLVRTLGDGCAKCGRKLPPEGEPLSHFHIDHVEGRDWDVTIKGSHNRIARMWREYHAGIPLRILCSSCNGWDGQRRGSGRPRHAESR